MYGQKIRQGHFGFLNKLNKFDFKQKWKTFLSSTDRIAQVKFQYAGLLEPFSETVCIFP